MKKFFFVALLLLISLMLGLCMSEQESTGEAYDVNMLQEKIARAEKVLENTKKMYERHSFAYVLLAPELTSEVAIEDPETLNTKIHMICQELREQNALARSNRSKDIPGIISDELEAFLTEDITYEELSLLLMTGNIKEVKLAEIIGHGIDKQDLSKRYPLKEKDLYKEEKVAPILAALTNEELSQIRLEVIRQYYDLDRIMEQMEQREEDLAELKAELDAALAQENK